MPGAKHDLTEMWSAMNACFWSCLSQTSGVQEVTLNGRHFRVIRLVTYLRPCYF